MPALIVIRRHLTTCTVSIFDKAKWSHDYSHGGEPVIFAYQMAPLLGDAAPWATATRAIESVSANGSKVTKHVSKATDR